MGRNVDLVSWMFLETYEIIKKKWKESHEAIIAYWWIEKDRNIVWKDYLYAY